MRLARVLFLPLIVVSSLQAQASADAPARLAATLARIPTEQRMAGGHLRVVNLYKLQAQALLPQRGLSRAARLDRLARTVYRPYPEFWQGYVGDAAAFRAWAAKSLLPGRSAYLKRLGQVAALPLDSLFTTNADWVARTTGHQPEGTWYLVVGPGWTNMGGLGETGMLIDFAEAPPIADSLADVLPHELTHMAFGAAPARRADPDRGTVLERILSEGVASYAAYARADGRFTPAQALFFSDAEWQAAIAQEGRLQAAAAPLLMRRDRAALDSVSSRQQQLVAGTPPAAGYFLGFRIVSAYETRFGPGSWPQVLDLPLAEVVKRSGYALGAATEG